MNWYKIAQEEKEMKFPTVTELTNILRNHPLVKNIGRVKRGFVVGSFAKGTQNPNSDIDVLLEIAPIKGTTAEEWAESRRNQIRKYFMQNNITGINDSIHPRWNGRRIDIYFTYDASTETRPKVELPL